MVVIAATQLVLQWQEVETKIKESGTLEDKDPLGANLIQVWEVCDKTYLEWTQTVNLSRAPAPPPA